MKFKLMHVLMLFAILIAPLWAVDGNGLFEAGNRAFEEGDYALAIEQYQRVLGAQLESPELYYNLGCAYFQMEQMGPAILNFEKARQLAPRDKDIQHNLSYAELFLKDRFDVPEPMPFVSWFVSARESFSLDELTRVESILLVLLAVALVTWRLNRSPALSSVLSVSVAVLALLFVLSGGWLLDRVMNDRQNHGVLLAESQIVTSGPAQAASQLFVIHEGTRADILEETNGWYKIRLVDGKTGWVPDEVMGIY